MENLKHTDLLKSDWNTLVILDACRYDLFKKLHNFKGTLKKADSEAINTPEWYQKHWLGREGNTDITLITANPQAYRQGELKFKKVIRAWDGAIVPENLELATTLKAYQGRSNGDRTVVHFMPPHIPFIGEFGKKLMDKISFSLRFVSMGQFFEGVREMSFILPNLEDALTGYGIAGNWDKLQKAYKESLQLALNFLEIAYSYFKPPVVLTSDHGELTGESDLYGHGHEVDDLLELQSTVPWFEFDDDEMQIDCRLRALGYGV